jgi:hypothetical protein
MRLRLRISTCLAFAALGLGAVAAAAAPVSGRLASPAGTLPALTVFAWSLAGDKLYSITTDSGQVAFTLDLPPGRYYVFAAPVDPGAPAIYGAYTEFAACSHDGAHAGCSAHGLRTLLVKKRPVHDVDLTDWYLDDTVTRELDRILGRPVGATPAESELAAPKFSEYPAAPGAPARATALATGDEPRIERDREPLTAALTSSVNFAGRTVLLRIGCGEHCESVALVDLPTGRVAYPAVLAQLPADSSCTPNGALQFRRDSRLLTVTGANGHERVTRYFVWDADAGTLRLVASLASALGAGCTPAR